MYRIFEILYRAFFALHHCASPSFYAQGDNCFVCRVFHACGSGGYRIESFDISKYRGFRYISKYRKIRFVEYRYFDVSCCACYFKMNQVVNQWCYNISIAIQRQTLRHQNVERTGVTEDLIHICLLYTSPSPRD